MKRRPPGDGCTLVSTFEKQKEYVALTIASYNNGEFDPSIPTDTPRLTAADEPRPTEAEQQHEREAAEDSAVSARMAEHNTAAARAQRGARRSDAGDTTEPAGALQHQPHVDLGKRARRPRHLHQHAQRVCRHKDVR